jgi:hypothetical protein
MRTWIFWLCYTGRRRASVWKLLWHKFSRGHAAFSLIDILGPRVFLIPSHHETLFTASDFPAWVYALEANFDSHFVNTLSLLHARM